MDGPHAAPGGIPPGRLTDAEALMWRVEEDPWFSSTVGVAALLDRPADHERLRRRVAAGVAADPLLSARVVPGPLGSLRWEPDPDFDLDHHVRHLVLPGAVGERALLDLACRLVDDPLDRTRPLWRLWSVDPGRGTRGGLVWKLHHAVTDGQAALGLAQLFVDLERDPEAAPSLDPAALRRRIRASARRDGAPEDGAAGPDVVGLLGRVLGAQAEAVRRVAAEAMLVGADPARLTDAGSAVMDEVARIGR